VPNFATAAHERRDGGACDLTVVVPITRAWAVSQFFAALDASDVPRETSAIIAYVDSDDGALVSAVRPHLEGWRTAVLHVSGWAPPEDNAPANRRRKRHAAMRLALRGLMPRAGAVLMLEDDTLVPRDVLARLTHVLAGADVATGAQVGRWGVVRCNGLWHETTRGDGRTVLVSRIGTGIGYVDACGLYAMLTDASVYRALDFRTWHQDAGQDVSVTLRASRAGVRIGVDYDCGCGHLTPKGIISPSAATHFERTVDMLTIETPSGPFWAPDDPLVKKEAAMNARDTYTVHQRIIKGGAVLHGKGAQIPMTEAVELARQGFISDPALGPLAYQGQVLPGVEAVADAPAFETPEVPLAQYETPVAPPVEVKAQYEYEPDEQGLYICPVCFKSYKTPEGIAKHVAAKHA